MEIDYYSKYLKYKSKYIELRNQMGGVIQCCDSCNCKKYQWDKEYTSSNNTCTCGHKMIGHSYDQENVTQECSLKTENTNTRCCKCNCVKYELDKKNKKCTCNHIKSDHKKKCK